MAMPWPTGSDDGKSYSVYILKVEPKGFTERRQVQKERRQG